ncbi:hypothetical protein CC1G_02902 [Coprinopsis cinerea okayama7|uniref:Geranylgeranyl pyrophosphate synthetase n=1 Tax=Coprinopsis cinerea (strain Okayama-7 / 130 / ATCC MYA-4618 / FGSC 9003) TaxID=240176 RepID=A8NRN3_COPC7|nr:hypothetical protein CC1G_02902 [Coprinopsis cinerea okayama7\|eukprot:XP_001835814.2 hypothetical protein CC1G_02902 [Coprinopsis cinerea okayama7\
MAAVQDRSPWRNSTFVLPPSYSYGGSMSRSVRGRPNPNWSPRKIPEPGVLEALPPDREISEGLKDDVIAKIEVPQVEADDENVSVKDCQYIGSYSWTDRETPTIIVPGAPPQWQNRSAPYNVQPDRGVFFVDQNGYRMGAAPLVPLIAAVNARAEATPQLEFDWYEVDFVTDRNALRKLVRWVKDQNPKDFRIDLELAGERTVLMNRWEKRTREHFNGRTFGFNFEKASTLPVPDCREGTGHHRIVSYDLNGLKMVVRFEVDACIPPPRSYSRRSVATVDEITASLANVDLSKRPTPACEKRFQVNVIKGGYEVSPSAIMELSTRSEYKQHEYDFKELYPQLFFSQTTHHVLAVHNRGRFSAIHRRKLSSPELQQVDIELQPSLKAVRKALKVIQDLVIEHGQRGRLSLVCKDGVLRVYERTSVESCLPDHLMELFENPGL